MIKNSKEVSNNNNIVDVAVLGATGVVGQVFLSVLADHSQFNIAVITASDSRAGKLYSQEVHWTLPTALPEAVGQLELEVLDAAVLKKKGVKIVFSALPSDVAAKVEPGLREKGFYVFTNAGALRYEKDVPILIPDVNPESLDWIRKQGFPEKGFVVTNSNCSTAGLAVALAPLRPLGIEEVFVSTYQSISGAGYPGLPSLDILGNAVPYIEREEEKLIIEVQKILNIEASIYPHCVRIPVVFGHLETVWLTFEKDVEADAVLSAWKEYKVDTTDLPSVPVSPVVYDERPAFPQSRDSFLGEPAGMQVFTGRLRKEQGRIGFCLLVNNLVKGGAGGSVANAELFLREYKDLIK